MHRTFPHPAKNHETAKSGTAPSLVRTWIRFQSMGAGSGPGRSRASLAGTSRAPPKKCARVERACAGARCRTGRGRGLSRRRCSFAGRQNHFQTQQRTCGRQSDSARAGRGRATVCLPPCRTRRSAVNERGLRSRRCPATPTMRLMRGGPETMRVVATQLFLDARKPSFGVHKSGKARNTGGVVYVAVHPMDVLAGQELGPV